MPGIVQVDEMLQRHLRIAQSAENCHFPRAKNIFDIGES